MIMQATEYVVRIGRVVAIGNYARDHVGRFSRGRLNDTVSKLPRVFQVSLLLHASPLEPAEFSTAKNLISRFLARRVASGYPLCIFNRFLG